MFKGDKQYQEWDVDGIPVKTVDGGELSKSQVKKLRKEWEKQKKLHGEYLIKFGAGA
jgi:cysteinyl-tRNA synthetase